MEELEVSNNDPLEKLLQKAKQCLSIVQTATSKDEEIKMWINSAIEDLHRQGINASVATESELVKSAIMMFVKANFGNTDVKEKELARNTYSLLCCNLGLSSDYKESDSNA